MKFGLTLFFTFLFALIPTISFGQYTTNNLEGKELILKETVNVNRKVYVRDEGETAYYIHNKSRLFPVRKNEPVKIRSVKVTSDYTEIKFISTNLGKGEIRIYDASTPKLFNNVITSAFSTSSNTSSSVQYILNKNSNVIHFAGSNHLPPKEHQVVVGEEELLSEKHKKCSLCFFNIPKVSGYDLEMQLGNFSAGQVQLQNPLVTDDAVQLRVKKAGKRVLDKWMMPLKGYHYKFFAVESDITNAFAAAGGKVFITTALLNSLESEEELEAILAHEIAHVELRHGYRQFRSAQKAAFWGGIIAIAVGAGNQAAFDLVNILNQIASSIVLSGHNRRYESEADSLSYIYFESNNLGNGKTSFRNVLRKLQYNQDFYQPEEKGTSLLASHPNIASRIDAVENSEMKVFSDDVFYGYNAEDELVATISFQAQRAYKGTLNKDDVGLQIIALVETTSALEKNDSVGDIEIVTDSGVIKMDNKENTEILPNDAVGASFSAKNIRNLVESIKGIKLKLRNVVKWTKDTPAVAD